MRRIDTLSPGTLQEALEILAREGEGVKVIAGGTDLVVQVLERRKSPRLLLNLSRIGDLREIGEDGETVRIGALVTHRQIERSPILKRRAPLLCEAALLIGSPQLRNLATIGGNIVNASPVADSTPPLMALDATVSLRSARGERKIPLRAFFLGPGKTVIRRDELLAEVSFAGLGPDAASFYERLGQRRLLSISKVGVALAARRAARGLNLPRRGRLDGHHGAPHGRLHRGKAPRRRGRPGGGPDRGKGVPGDHGSALDRIVPKQDGGRAAPERPREAHGALRIPASDNPSTRVRYRKGTP